MNATIEIYGSMSILKGNYPSFAVRAATSYPVDGAQYSKAYRRGVWDGRKHLFNKKTGAFPTGLLDVVVSSLDDNGVIHTIEDKRLFPSTDTGSFDLVGVKMEGKYDYQLDACEKMIEKKQGIVKIATNGGKTEIACAVTKYLNLKTLFVVTSRELLYQARDRFMARLGATEQEIGIIGDGNWLPGSLCTVAIVDTLESRLNRPECQQFIKDVDVLFVDEAHHMGSETWYTVCTLCPAYYRFGLSGTPLDRTDGANLRLIAATGPKIVDIDNKFLVEREISAKAEIIFDKVNEPVLKKRIRYNTAYKQGVVENPQLLEKIVDWTKVFREAGLGVLILVEEIGHGNLVDDALWNDTGGVFIPHQFIHGTEDSGTRRKALADFASGNLPVLIASTILDEGVDVPTIDALILAGSRKSRIRTMQRLGRGLRGKKLIVVEFANYTNKYLAEHSLQRLEDYQKEGCFEIYQSAPDIDLVTKLWESADEKNEADSTP